MLPLRVPPVPARAPATLRPGPGRSSRPSRDRAADGPQRREPLYRVVDTTNDLSVSEAHAYPHGPVAERRQCQTLDDGQRPPAPVDVSPGEVADTAEDALR